MLKCARCKGSSFSFCQDAITRRVLLETGEADLSNPPDVSELQNTWIECDTCHKTWHSADEIKAEFDKQEKMANLLKTLRAEYKALKVGQNIHVKSNYGTGKVWKVGRKWVHLVGPSGAFVTNHYNILDWWKS